MADVKEYSFTTESAKEINWGKTINSENLYLLDGVYAAKFVVGDDGQPKGRNIDIDEDGERNVLLLDIAVRLSKDEEFDALGSCSIPNKQAFNALMEADKDTILYVRAKNAKGNCYITLMSPNAVNAYAKMLKKEKAKLDKQAEAAKQEEKKEQTPVAPTAQAPTTNQVDIEV